MSRRSARRARTGWQLHSCNSQKVSWRQSVLSIDQNACFRRRDDRITAVHVWQVKALIAPYLETTRHCYVGGKSSYWLMEEGCSA